MTSGHDHKRPVLDLHVVHHHADGGEIVVGVGIEGPVLVPFHGRAETGGLHVELRRVEADIRPPEVLEHGDDARMARPAARKTG